MVKQITLFDDFPLALGGSLSPITIAYQTYGKLNADKSNAVLLCHALTGDAEPYTVPPHKGWWQDFIGSGLAFDTDRYFFICSNVLGGCKGTTGPASINPHTSRPYGSAFPIITVQDIVRVQKALLDHLHIPHLKAVVGGSFGGMQATQWGIFYPDFVDNIVNLCASLTLSAEAVGFNHIMRQAIINDPHFNGGDYYDNKCPPTNGLKIARMLGMLTYRTDVQLEKAFGREIKQHGEIWGDHFQVESYLSYQGDKFLDRFDANSYLRLLRALDLYDPALGFRSEQEALSRIKANYRLIGITSDQLFKQKDLHKSRQRLIAAGVKVEYDEFYSHFGHDAFLVDYDFFAPMIKQAIAK